MWVRLVKSRSWVVHNITYNILCEWMLMTRCTSIWVRWCELLRVMWHDLTRSNIWRAYTKGANVSQTLSSSACTVQFSTIPWRLFPVEHLDPVWNTVIKMPRCYIQHTAHSIHHAVGWSSVRPHGMHTALSSKQISNRWLWHQVTFTSHSMSSTRGHRVRGSRVRTFLHSTWRYVRCMYTVWTLCSVRLWSGAPFLIRTHDLTFSSQLPLLNSIQISTFNKNKK